MDDLKDLILFLQIMIPLGAAARIAACNTYASMDNENKDSYKKKIRNLIIFVVLSETIGAIYSAAMGYFGGNVIPY